MQQFQVPQFITIEDKVIGPFTVKQFLYLLAGIAVIGLTYYFFQFYIVIPVAIFAGSLAGSLAFLKINERPFPTTLKNAVFYLLRPRLFLWKHELARRPAAGAAPQKEAAAIQSIPKLSASKLNDLAWSLDIEAHVKK